ncbi:MAG: hypothetical protein ACKPB7_36485, partial [Sphaerospermopsis kisseleviana]
MSRILNWDNEFLEMSQRIRDIRSSFATINQTQKQETEKLTQLQNDVISLAKDIGVSEDIIRNILDTNLQPSKSQSKLIWEDEIFLNNNFLIIEDRVKEEVF